MLDSGLVVLLHNMLLEILLPQMSICSITIAIRCYGGLELFPDPHGSTKNKLKVYCPTECFV